MSKVPPILLLQPLPSVNKTFHACPSVTVKGLETSLSPTGGEGNETLAAAPVPETVKYCAGEGVGANPGQPPVGDVTVKLMPLLPSPGALQVGVIFGVVTLSKRVTFTGVP